MEPTKLDILGVTFDNLTLEQAVERALELLGGQGSHYVVTPNPEIIRMAREDASLMHAIEDAAMVLPDGVGVIQAAKILGTPLKEKLPGIDFAAALMEKMAKRGDRLYLLGAKPGIAEQAAEQLQARYPGLIICGTHDGYFQDDAAAAAEILQAQTDVAFVCLGAPRQERWMQQWGEASGAKLLIGLGGSLDIFSGQSRRAPLWMQKSGLEWLYRLIREPWRLSRMMKIPGVLLWAYKERGKS